MPFPDFNPVLLHIGFISIRWYALAYIAGILLGWWYATRLIKTESLWGPAGPPISAKQLDDLVLWITLGVILGGRIGYVIAYGRGLYAADPLKAFRIWDGGMSFHGGFVGVVAAVAAFALTNRVNMLRLGDLVAPCAPFGLFFGRIANFINGELWGRTTHLPWGVVFCNQRLMDPGAGTCAAGLDPRHPSQLYEAGLEGVALFLILRWATHRAGGLRREGALVGLFMLFYGLFRIALENVRQPDEGLDNFPFGLTMGIILSTPMVVIGAWLLWRSRRLTPTVEAAPAARPPAT